jgi:8-oxo-dGTP pyrophosphatase MutT (NUDIX family)
MTDPGPSTTHDDADGRSVFERLKRRAFHLYFRLVRPMTLGVRGMAIDGEGRVFLVRHGYVPGWHLPGGGVETGETALEALRKEMMEEGRILVRGAPRLHGVFFNRHVSRRDHVLVYVIEDFVVEGSRAPDKEIAETGWFRPDALPPGTSAGTRARIAEALHGAPIGEDWTPRLPRAAAHGIARP